MNYPSKGGVLCATCVDCTLPPHPPPCQRIPSADTSQWRWPFLSSSRPRPFRPHLGRSGSPHRPAYSAISIHKIVLNPVEVTNAAGAALLGGAHPPRQAARKPWCGRVVPARGALVA